jgi:hypothetical protein
VCASFSLIGGPESRRCDINSSAHDPFRHLFCLISLRIAATPLRRPSLLAEINFTITDTISTSPRADIAHLLSMPAQMPRQVFVLPS